MLFLQLGHRPISRPLGARRQDDHSPSWRNLSAVAKPMPLLPPVISATLSFSLIFKTAFPSFVGFSLAESGGRFCDMITLNRPVCKRIVKSEEKRLTIPSVLNMLFDTHRFPSYAQAAALWRDRAAMR